MVRSTVLPLAAAAATCTSVALSFAVPSASSNGIQHLRGSEVQSAQSSNKQSPVQQATAIAVASAIAAAAVAQRRGTRQSNTSATRGTDVAMSKVVCAAGGGGPKKRVLIMGGTRFIGCYLVAKLRDLGHDVVLLNRGKTNKGLPDRLPGVSDAAYNKMLEGVTVLKADRKNPENIKTAVAGAGKFDIVFDNNVRKLEELQPLVEGLMASGGCEQFFLMSSAGVYGPTDVLPLNESTPGDPKSRHKEKLDCELYLASKNMNWTSIRPVYIYGPMNYNPVEQFFFDRVARGRPVCVPGDGKFITQLGHCEDLADFMVKCIGNSSVKGQVYNLSGEEYVTFDGMVKVCAQAAGVPEPKIVHFNPKSVTVPEDWPKAFPFRSMHFFAGIDKAKRDVPDWKPKYSLLEGLKSSYKLDFLARGLDKSEVDFRTDDLILAQAATK